MENEIFNRIDQLVAAVQKHQKSTLQEKITERENRKPNYAQKPNDVLGQFVSLIAFSQQAKAIRVTELVASGKLKEVFSDFNVAEVAAMNPCDIVDAHWQEIKAIRQQSKVFQIVMFARILNRKSSKIDVVSHLNFTGIPKAITRRSDIDLFWSAFRSLQYRLQEAGVPFLKETTTLSHYLLEQGYPCIKPDSAVMKAAQKLGIVDVATGQANLVKVVRTLQEYCLERKMLPAVLDLYLLIGGGQTGILDDVNFIDFETELSKTFN